MPSGLCEAAMFSSMPSTSGHVTKVPSAWRVIAETKRFDDIRDLRQTK
jgi:hypothetical protein